MLLSCSYILLCSCVAYAQVLKFSLQRDVGSVVPQNGTQIVELAYRYDNQFGWNNIASYPVKSCPCGPLVSGPGCGEIQLNIATTGIDVTRPVQFRWIQSGQGRYEWSLDAVSFRGLTYDDFQTMQALPRGDRWCDSPGGAIVHLNCQTTPPQSSLRFCASCRESVGAVTPLLVISGLVIILQPCRKGLDVLELQETPVDIANCTNDTVPIQVDFALSIGPSSNITDSVLLSVRQDISSSWIPLHLYVSMAPDYPWCGPSGCRIAYSGYNVSVIKINASRTLSQMRASVCVNVSQHQLQFMWSGKEGNRMDWLLGNLSLTMLPHCILLSEDFRSENSHLGSTLQDVIGGSVVVDRLNGGQVVFNVSNSSTAAMTIPVELSCPKSTTPISTSPSYNTCPQEAILDYTWPSTKEGDTTVGRCVQGRYRATRKCRFQTEALAAQWEMVNCSSPVDLSDPDMALLDLGKHNSVLAPAETLDLMQALSEVMGNYSASEVLGQRFISIASDVVDRTMNERQNVLIGSEFLKVMDHFALWTQNTSGNINAFESANIVLNVSLWSSRTQQPLRAVSCDDHSLTLPIEVFPHEQVRVAAYCYHNISQMLHDTSSSEPVIESPVLSASLNCATTQCRTINLHSPVVAIFQHAHLDLLISRGNVSTSCVYWQFERAENGTLSGHWSHDGCWKNRSLSSSTITVCTCSHLTHFAILLSPSMEAISVTNIEALYVIEIVGIVTSLIGLAATIFTFALLRPLWSLRSYVHVNLCTCLFVSQLTLLSVEGVKEKVLCAIMAVILQYLFLVVFMWMLMEGAVLYLALVVIFTSSNIKYMFLFALASYGLPALYMGAIVPVGFLMKDEQGQWQYGTTQSCWLRYDTHFVWSFISPVILILTLNVLVFGMAMTIMWRHHRSKTRVIDTKHWLKVAVSLTVVLGFTWIFGILYFNKYLVFFAYIFTICNTLQGLFIFIFIVVMSKQVREEYARWWRNTSMRFLPLNNRRPTSLVPTKITSLQCSGKPKKSRSISTATTKSSPDNRLSVTVLTEDPSPRCRRSLGSVSCDLDVEVFGDGASTA